MVTYVNDLRLNEIATGDSSGTWGTTTNTNLELIGEAMGYGTEAVANASTHTITMADGTTDGFRCTFLRLTGGGQACAVTLAPNTLSHTWIIRNTTGYALTFTQGSGANVIIAAGMAKVVTTDGLGAGAVVYECLYDLELGGKLNISGDATIGDDLTLLSDAAVVNFGVNSDVTLTHVHDSGLSLSAGGDSLTQLSLISTNETAGHAYPILTLNRDSASRANNDYLGQIVFYGDNNAAESTLYARVLTQMLDVADGSEDGRLFIQVMRAGALTTAVLIDEDEVWLNGTKGVTVAAGNLTFDTAGKGVHLGVTTPTAANLLDDYEEGTWTATLIGASASPSTPATQTGYYTKIGNTVRASVYIANKNTTGASGEIQVTGLPFSAAETGIVGTYMHYVLASGGSPSSTVYIAAGSTTARCIYSRDSNTWASVAIIAGTGKYLILSLIYRTAL
jgi:hypothetical protein